MNETIRLGRFFGVNVGVNWSLGVVFVLIAAGLAAGRFPDRYPGFEPGAYLAAGLGTAVLFFGSVLAHELGHAVVARRNGIEVEGITLWLFGGVARLLGEAGDPATELRVAGIGPAISVAVAAGAGLAAAGLDAAGASELLVGSAKWLAVINLVLAVFNLVPAAPLDGGRILRAFLWRRHGDPVRAAVTAARAGRTFGFVLIAVGLLEFAGGAGGGLWLAFVGWFLINAARAEEQAAEVKRALGGLRVRDLMSADPVLVPADASVGELIDRWMFRYRFGAFPVGSDHRSVVGLVTLEAVRRLPPEARTTTSVAEIAIPVDELRIRPDDVVADVLSRLGDGRRGLVFDDDRLIGIVSPSDVVRIMALGELRGRPPDLT